GKAIATRLASDGYALCLNDVPALSADLASVASSLSSIHSVQTTTYAADVSVLPEVEALVAHSVSSLGPLSTMVANAGIAQVKPLLDLSEQDLRRMFEVNVFGVYNCYASAARQMIAQGGGGKILGAASIVAFKPFPMLSHYSASKWAVRGLTQAFAMEVSRHKITVNAYAPGIVGTAMWDLIDEGLGKLDGRKRGETIKKYVEELTALGRTSTPEDVANVVGFLASDDSDFMTGQTVVVDGGIIYT
ncbi:NAD(P)-binding protein, partial [Pseudovirgaria hyperparasitica]